MKKIINGRKYNTDTATKLGEWWNNEDIRDFGHCEESLYVKNNGEYFLYGWGGPMTKYAVYESSNTYTGGESITPLTVMEAIKWAEKRLDIDEFEEIFGEVAE